MIKVDTTLRPGDLLARINKLFELSAEKILSIQESWKPGAGTPVFTLQAARWTGLPDNLGYIYTFNGAHSLFVDTIRSLRVLAVAHQLGHVLMGEQDRRISLPERLLRHAETTARYIVYFGEGRDSFDIRGRTAHEAIFNTNNGSYRCPGTQQGYSPFSTWTRGLAWVLCGFSEQLEFLAGRPL